MKNEVYQDFQRQEFFLIFLNDNYEVYMLSDLIALEIQISQLRQVNYETN